MQECNYFQGMEGEMDSTHAYFLHQWFDQQNIPSGPAGARGGSAAVGRPSFDFHQNQMTPRQTDFGMIRSSHSPDPSGGHRWRIDRWMIPNFSLISSPTYPVGGRVFVPIDDEHCTVFQYMSHPERPLTDDERRRLQVNAPSEKKYSPDVERSVYQLPGGYAIDTWRDKRTLQNDYLQDRDFQRAKNMSGIPAQRTQDTAMVERQGEGPVVDRSLEHLSATDAPIIKMRAILLEACRDLQQGKEPYNASHPEAYSTVSVECVSEHLEVERALDDQLALLRSHARPWKDTTPAPVAAG
jgi:hypothetical protein